MQDNISKIIRLAKSDQYTLRMIAESHSISSSREIINENFKNLSWIIECIQNLPLSLLLTLKVPTNPKAGVQYSITFNETTQSYELIEGSSNINAGQWHIQRGQTLKVSKDYQHIVYGKFLNEGNLDIEGELMIL